MTNEYFINNKDAFTHYGVILDRDSLGALMAPPSLKEYVKNDDATKNGTAYSSQVPKVKERNVTLIFHLYADTPADAQTKYNAFVAVLLQSVFKLKVMRTGVTYHLLYKSSTSFVPWFDGIAKYTLSLTEPNPMNHTT